MVAKSAGASHRRAVEPVDEDDQPEGNGRKEDEGELAGLQVQADGAKKNGEERYLGEFCPSCRPQGGDGEEFDASDEIGGDSGKAQALNVARVDEMKDGRGDDNSGEEKRRERPSPAFPA